MTYKFSNSHGLNEQSTSVTQAPHIMPRIAVKNSRLRRMYRGLLASAGIAAFALGSAPALAGPTYLGTAQNFAVLGGSTVTNTGSSVITGDLGVSPGTAVTGFPPGTVSGTVHLAGAPAAQAQSDVTAAYDALTSQSCTQDLTGQDLGGMTLEPGVYCFSTSAQLTGTLMLNTLGDPNAVFIFKMGSTLNTASNSSVSVTNGTTASSCGVSWQVGSSATLGTTTSFLGNIVAQESISLQTGANVIGRVLARTGAVTLDNNNVSAADCPEYSSDGLFGPNNGDPNNDVPIAAASIPTLSEWAMILLASLLAMLGFAAMRKQAR